MIKEFAIIGGDLRTIKLAKNTCKRRQYGIYLWLRKRQKNSKKTKILYFVKS